MGIRKFRIDDIEQIMEIESLAFPKSPYPREVFIYYALQPETNFLIYEIGERVVGYIIFQNDGHVVSIAVHPKWRRRGIGTELMKKVFEKTGGKARIEVRVSNKIAIEFYKKLGFIFKDRIKKYYITEDAFVMIRF